MPSTTRTYLTTDWNLWVYTPVAGKFRLDFSLLNGPYVLSSTNGTMAISDAEITSISINDGGELSLGSLASFNVPMATIGIKLVNFTKSMLAEYYPGKRIALTLKNEASATSSNITYGYNSVIFNGTITDAQLDLDPITNIAQLSLTATDYLSAILNSQITVIKNTSTDKGTLLYEKIYSLVTSFSAEIPYYEFGNLQLSDTHYGAAVTQTDTVGTFLDEFYTSEVKFPTYWLVEEAGAAAANAISYVSLYTNSWANQTVTPSKIGNIEIGNSASTVPTNFKLSATNGATLNINSSVSSNPYNTINYSAQVDVLNSSELLGMYNKMIAVEPVVFPSTVEVIIARNYQPITFTNLQGIYSGSKWYPNGFQFTGSSIVADLSQWGFSSTEAMIVTGKSIEVTTEDFRIIYTVTKGP
jgi:hypothetical protein